MNNYDEDLRKTKNDKDKYIEIFGKKILLWNILLAIIVILVAYILLDKCFFKVLSKCNGGDGVNKSLNSFSNEIEKFFTNPNENITRTIIKTDDCFSLPVKGNEYKKIKNLLGFKLN